MTKTNDPKVGQNSTRVGGRGKGTPNKRTKAVAEKLAALGCDPIEGMAIIAKQAMNDDDLVLAGNMYKELAQYVAPKRKAIEVTGADDEPLFAQSTDTELARKIAYILAEEEHRTTH